MEDYYQSNINKLNDNLNFLSNQNNELKNENNILKLKVNSMMGKNDFDEKLLQNGDELYKELITIKNENEELKKELEKFKK